MVSDQTRGNRQTSQVLAPRQPAFLARLAIPGLIVAYLMLLILPLAAAWLQGLPPRRWQDDLSSGLALCAFAGILLEFLLSGRFRFVSDHIGTDTTMRVHQLMARALTLAILVHPFLYVTGAANYPEAWDTTRQTSVDFGATAVLTGLVAWLALTIVVVMGIFREQRGGSYESWRAGHGIGAVVVAVFGTWHALDAGRYSEHWFLAWFWIAMLIMAMLTLAWVYLIKPIWQRQNPYVVQTVRRIADRTWELVIAPVRGVPITFRAGQFVWLNVGHSPFSLYENPFSIASAPTQRNELHFVIKEVGDSTRLLGDIKPGTATFIDGPHGNMTIAERGGEGIAFYAGGVGIAPILSMLRDLKDRRDRRPLLLLYGNRAAEQIVYQDELDALTQQLDFTVEHFLSEPPVGWKGRSGMIGRTVLDEVFLERDAREWLHVICGPLPMIEGIERALLLRGVRASQIISERFYYD